MATTYVDFTTNLGDIVIQLYDDAAPQTVADFLSYAENTTQGDGYTDSFFHRLAAGFVLQGGGYDVTPAGIAAIPTAAPVQNEYNPADPNTEGTIAMAKVGNDPNSATDEFFFNLADNSSNLDNQDGGFTVFGTVTPESWPVVEAIAGLPTVNASGAFTNLPVEGTVANNTVTTSNLVIITNVTVSSSPPPCYGRGTRIRTGRGEIAVEDLAVGDAVVIASGGTAPVRWLGHRRVDCRRHGRPENVWPVRVARHAFGHDMPVRDLLLSPDHAVFFDEVLIPIKHLINGRSVAQIAVDQVEYWHVELDRHDVILAENLPAESYLDTGNRAAFANGGGVVQLHPDFIRPAFATFCAPLVQDGACLAAVKARLFARAGLPTGRPALLFRVLADQQELFPELVGSRGWSCPVPPGSRAINLVSTQWMPAGHHAASLDRRVLGVRLFAIEIDGLAVGLDAPWLLSGFHDPETTGEGRFRWTDGDARIVLPIGAAQVTLWFGDDARPWVERKELFFEKKSQKTF